MCGRFSEPSVISVAAIRNDGLLKIQLSARLGIISLGGVNIRCRG